jgi:hypothetical protein
MLGNTDLLHERGGTTPPLPEQEIAQPEGDCGDLRIVSKAPIIKGL